MHKANQVSKDATYIRHPNKFANRKCSRDGYTLLVHSLGFWSFTPGSGPCFVIHLLKVGLVVLIHLFPIKHEGKREFSPTVKKKCYLSECREHRKTCFTVIEWLFNELGHKAFLQVFATLF